MPDIFYTNNHFVQLGKVEPYPYLIEENDRKFNDMTKVPEPVCNVYIF